MNNVFIIILSIIMLWFCLNQIFKITKTNYIYLYAIIYVILLYLVLFNREKFDESIYSDGTYITKWIKLIFTNKVVINKESTNMTNGLSPVTSINSSSSVCNPRSVNNDTNG